MFLWLWLACAPRPAVEPHGDGPTLSELRAGIGLAPVQFVQDVPAPPLPTPPPAGVVESALGDATDPPPTPLDPVRDAAFLRNEFVGNVRFGGGFIRTGDVALDARARFVEFTSQDPYRVQAERWLHTTVVELLDDHHVPFTPVPVGAAADRVPRRGMHEDDGRDDVNLPRTDLVPTTLNGDPGGQRWVLVPYLRAYYSHNGGWFLGQEYGCMAGARVEVTLALFDTTRQLPVWWSAVVGRHLDLRVAQPSTAELDQFLLWAEDLAEDGLAKGFLRDGKSR